jgi:hypothetical protein
MFCSLFLVTHDSLSTTVPILKYSGALHYCDIGAIHPYLIILIVDPTL